MNDAVLIRIPISALYTVGFIDSAGGRVAGPANKSRSQNKRSRSAIVIVSQDDLDRIFIRKAWARHCTTDALADEIFATQAEFHPAVFGIDASANQALFADALIREAREKNRKLPLSKVSLGTDKDVRIETTLQPCASGGRLFALCDMMDLREEWEAFPGSQYKDLLDALAGAVKLLPTRSTNQELASEIDQYRNYLRSGDMPEVEIEERVFNAFGREGE